MGAPRPWTVKPHDPILEHEDVLWSVRGTVRPGAVMDRRMAIARLADGRLVFYNAVPLQESAMAEIESRGTPAFLIVPNGYHRLDIHAFKARYPGMKLLTPAAVARRVGAVAGVDGDPSALPADPKVAVEALDGTRIGEPVLVVTTGGRRSLVFGDAVMNLPSAGGFEGLVLRFLGSAGGPKVTRIARWFMVSGAARLRDHLERLATPDLARILPSHGGIIEDDAAAVLRRVAAALGG